MQLDAEGWLPIDELIAKVNQNDIDNKKAHYKEVRAELETKANSLIDKLNKLG